MSEQADPQLVREIADAVLRRLGAGTPVVTAADPSTRRADVRPPIGVCTGDYSKFPELYGERRSGATGPVTDGGSAAAASAGATNPTDGGEAATRRSTPGNAGAPVLTGVVTASRVDGVHGASLRLAPGAILTPLARDRAKERRMTVERVSSASAALTERRPASSAAPWLWWSDVACQSVNDAMAPLVASFAPLVRGTERVDLQDALGRLADAVGGGRAAGGVLFVDTGGPAVCLANRRPPLRAVVATTARAVEESARCVAANVLVVERSAVGPDAMRSLIDRFVQTERPAESDVAVSGDGSAAR